MAEEFDKVAVLRRTQYFQDMTYRHLSSLAECLVYKDFADGEILANEGEPRAKAFFIVQGEVQRTKLVDGQKMVIDVAKTGTCLGLLHLLNEDPSFATATAVGQVKVFYLGSKEFSKVLVDEPLLSRAFTYTLAKKVRQFSKILPKQDHSTDSKPRVVLYDSKSYWVQQFNRVNEAENLGFEIHYVNERLSPATATLAEGAVAVICFVNDDASAASLRILADVGVQMISMRCAGYDRVDLQASRAFGLLVTRVPAYSPYAVAEHAMSLCLSLNRHLCRASQRTREYDFRLEGLLGFDMYGKTVGVLGTGRIGQIFIDICLGFGCKIIAYDKFPSKALIEAGNVQYVTQEQVLANSDVISLHAPLLPETHHMINDATIATMKQGVIIINCGRGGLIDTKALIRGLTSGHVGGAGLDVYENESEYFFADPSAHVVQDQDLSLLLQFPNVILTAHQAFFTQEGVGEIARVSLNNVKKFVEGATYQTHPNVVKCD
uniref:Cyclic nucleotide-binding domain-containing protein n=1 Tax=Eutreptiella gymnastica TaxID=73025 RepID=A0A7S1IRP1_9EUGL